MEAISKCMFYKLPSADLDLWKEIEEKLSSKIADFKELVKTINHLSVLVFPKAYTTEDLFGLEIAISSFSSLFNFFDEVLPLIQKDCLSMPEIFKSSDQKIGILPQGQDSEVILSGKQVRCILAHAFFNTMNTYLMQNPNFPKGSRFGNISFYQLYLRPYSESVERLKCLIYYFYCVYKLEEPNEEIVFLRKVLLKVPDWKSIETSVNTEVNISDEKRIEDTNAYMRVDFANKNLQIHENIPSCTQEEVLFSVRPALYVTLLISETLLEKEAIFMLGCKEYCEYKGYLETFLYDGPSKDLKENIKNSGIIAIDSVVNWNGSQFSEENIERDLNKAYLGFWGVDQEIEEFVKKHETVFDIKKVSTGNWGCGAFGGDPVLKFVQQKMAAAVANKTLDYSTFGDKKLYEKLSLLNQKINERNFKVKDLYEIMVKFQGDFAKCI